MDGRRSICIRCGKFKSRAEFSVRKGGGPSYLCGKCESKKKAGEIDGNKSA